MAEIDTSTDQLVESIDESKATALAMAAQHGSQAQAIMSSLNEYAGEARGDMMRETVADDAERMNLYGQSSWIEEDAMADLTQDFDTSVGGISNEMMLQQQALMNRLESSNQAMSNYMDSIASAMPALEERMKATIEMYRKDAAGYGGGGGGGGGGEGYGPLIPDREWLEDVHTGAGLGSSYKDDYDDLYDKVLTPDEKQAMADMWGLDMGVWDAGISSFADRSAENPEWGSYVVDTISSLYGANPQEVGALVSSIISNDGELDAGAHIDQFNGTFNMLVANGMDPQAARQVAMQDATQTLKQQVWYKDMLMMDPAGANQIARQLDITAGLMYAGTMMAAGQEWDQSVFGSPFGNNLFSLSGIQTSPPPEAAHGGVLAEAEWQAQQDRIASQSAEIFPNLVKDPDGRPRVAGLEELADMRRGETNLAQEEEVAPTLTASEFNEIEQEALTSMLTGTSPTPAKAPPEQSQISALQQRKPADRATFAGEDYDPVMWASPRDRDAMVGFDRDIPMMEPPEKEYYFGAPQKWAEENVYPRIGGYFSGGDDRDPLTQYLQPKNDYTGSKAKEVLQDISDAVAPSYAMDSPQDFVNWKQKSMDIREGRLKPPEAERPEAPKGPAQPSMDALKELAARRNAPDLEANKKKLQEQAEDGWAWYQKNFLDYRSPTSRVARRRAGGGGGF